MNTVSECILPAARTFMLVGAIQSVVYPQCLVSRYAVSFPLHASPLYRLPPRYGPEGREREKKIQEMARLKGETSMVLDGLQPEAVWKHFDKIRSTPHCSGHERALAEYIRAYAASRRLECATDSCGNLRVCIPASHGRHHRPTLVVQAHLDMVCEKNTDAEHDFSKEPIGLMLSDGWLSAQGTTLGADNGIGVACALALIDSPHIEHGPLELLFTVDEETGLVGASQLDTSLIRGRMLINLDSEELGVIYIGCAGGSIASITLPVLWEEIRNEMHTAVIKVRGLQGGHSGLDIDKNRGNAIKILTGLLEHLGTTVPFHLAAIEGGNKHNAIPREAWAEVVFPGDISIQEVQRTVAMEAQRLRMQMLTDEPTMEISIETGVTSSGRAMDARTQEKLIKMLAAIPHGVEAMSADIAGLVETSNNLAMISIEGDTVRIGTMARSSVESKMEEMEKRVMKIAMQAGAKAVIGERYPGWQPNLASGLLSLTINAYTDVMQTEPEIKAVHAGLECGILGRRFPDMDMVSIGPTIQGAHSPAERVDIGSVEVFWKVFVRLLSSI